MEDKILADILLTLKQVSAEIKDLREENAELKQIISGKMPSVHGWMRTSKAASLLQSEGVQSVNHLRVLIAQGVFAEGRGEIRNVSGGDRPTWEIYMPKAKSALTRYFNSRQAG